LFLAKSHSLYDEFHALNVEIHTLKALTYHPCVFHVHAKHCQFLQNPVSCKLKLWHPNENYASAILNLKKIKLKIIFFSTIGGCWRQEFQISLRKQRTFSLVWRQISEQNALQSIWKIPWTCTDNYYTFCDHFNLLNLSNQSKLVYQCIWF